MMNQPFLRPFRKTDSSNRIEIANKKAKIIAVSKNSSIFVPLKKLNFIFNLISIYMLNHYETVFIATPVLSDAQIKETVQKFKSLIESEGGEVVSEEDWGLRKLAYPIQKKSTGFYYLLDFKAEGTFVKKLETEYRRDERIIRFLTFAMDKHAVEYSEKRRKKRQEPEKKEN
jgi:small subunit ribosomal protein S6